MKNASPPVKRAILAGAAALASLLVLAAPVLAQASFSGGGRAVRVGWWDLTGVNDRDENGNPRGYDYEYLEAIAQYTGWKYTFVPVSLSEGLKMIESGELDVMGCISYNPERAGRMDYSEQPAGTGGNRLLCRMGDDRFSYGDLSAIDGKTVGSLAGSAWTERMRQYCASYHFSVRFVEADSEEVLLRELDDKSLDLVLWSQARSAGEYRSVLDFDQRPFYFVVSKSSPEVLEQMNLAMAQIKAGQPNYDAELRSKYFEVYTRLSPSFTKEEQAYIASHKEVTVAYDPAWYPIEYTDAATGTLGGIMKEIYALISERTGITFRFLTSDSFSGVYRNYGGKTQLNSILCYDFNWAQTWNVRLTPPVFDVQLECIYAEKAGKAVALPKDYYVAHYVQEHYSGENFSYQYYATVPECMDAVRTGKADMTFINSLELSYYLSMPKYGRLHFQSAPGVTLRYAVGVSGEADPLLFSILGKALGNISEAEISQIITANTVTRPTGSLTELIYTNPLLILSVVVAFLLFAGAAAYLCVRSRFVMRESRKLEAVNEQLSRANAAKGEFLSRMSHDIRTPMNGIIGMTHIAKNDPSRTRDCLEKIDVSSQYLLELINDILDMSKIDSGDMTLHPEPYTEADFRQYLNSVIFPLCEAKRQTVRLSVRSVPDRVVLVDRLRANQVLFNLLSNAVKYTPGGGVITCSVEAKPRGGRAEITLTVADNGCGMSEEFQKVMFRPFTQEDHVRTSENGGNGSGLGLSIVRRIVDLAGGTIAVRSTEGAGSTFRIRVCADTVAAGTLTENQGGCAGRADAEGLSGRHVLVCEDNAINQEIIRTILENRGVLADIAGNGQAGKQLFEASETGFYDAVLMDIRMPLLDGYETTQAIRELKRPDAAGIPIVAMTADAFDDDIRKCLAAGMNAHIAKPIDPNELYRKLRELL